ncbi:MAG: hypothetical protein K6F61_04205 [Clostridiales bacterium]|nr:hypothetical protein [Clostridiales bacterium]
MKNRKVLVTALLLMCLCLLYACAAASGIETDEEGGTWDYDRGIYTDPTGQTHQIESSGDGGSSSGSSPMIIDTGETDPTAGMKKNEDGSIEIESGTGGVDIQIAPTAAPMTDEEWAAALAAAAAKNGKDTPAVWKDPATGSAQQVKVVYMGIGRSMIQVNGESRLVNTADMTWNTEAPAEKVLAVVASRQVYLHKNAARKSLGIKQIYRDSVVRVLATGKNWTFVDHAGDCGYILTSALDFYANDHTDFEGGYLSLNGKTTGKGRVQVRDFETNKILEGFKPGTPVTVFDILEDYNYAEIDVEGLHCYVKLDCLTLESALSDAVG